MLSNPTEQEWLQTLTASLGAVKAAALIAAMKKAHPEKAIRTLSYGVGASTTEQRDAHGGVEARAAGAPVYTYLFSWQSPMLDGWLGLAHGRARFLLRQHQAVRAGHGQHAEAQALAKKMANAWANFARNGQSQPAGPGLDAVRTEAGPDHGVRQQVPNGERSRGRGSQDPVDRCLSLVLPSFRAAPVPAVPWSRRSRFGGVPWAAGPGLRTERSSVAATARAPLHG